MVSEKCAVFIGPPCIMATPSPQSHILAGNLQRHINHYLSLYKHVLQCRDDTKSQG